MPTELSDSYETLFKRAFTQMVVGKSQEAVDLLQRIVGRLGKLDPKTLERKPERQALLINAWDSAVQFLRWQKRFDDAMALCERFSQDRPDLVTVQVRFFSLMIEKGQVEEGLAGLRQLAEDKGEFEPWASLGQEYRALGRYAEAEPCFKMALSLAQSNVGSSSVYEELFTVYKETGRIDDALEAWNMNVVLAPEQAEETYRVCRWLIERGDAQKAQGYLARERDPIRHRFYQGLLDWYAGRPREARSVWQSVLSIQGVEDKASAAEWMEAALRVGRPGDVVGLAEQMGKKDRWVSEVEMTMVGLARAMQGNIPDAQKEFQEAVQVWERRWPARGRIPGWWRLATDVVSDPGVLEAISLYFEKA